MIVFGVEWNNLPSSDLSSALPFQLRHHTGRTVVSQNAVTLLRIPNTVCSSSAAEIQQQTAWRHGLSNDLTKRVANPRIARMLCHHGVIVGRKAIMKTCVFLQV